MISCEKIGMPMPSSCSMMAVIAMSRKALRWRRISGMNQRSPNGWFSSSSLCWRLSSTSVPDQLARKSACSTRPIWPLPASGSSTASRVPCSPGCTPATMTELPSCRRASSGKMSLSSTNSAQLESTRCALKPRSVAMRSSSRSSGSLASSAYSCTSRSGKAWMPWCWAIAVRHWRVEWRYSGVMPKSGLGFCVDCRWRASEQPKRISAGWSGLE